MSATEVLEMLSRGCGMPSVGLSTNRKTNYRIRHDDAITYPVIGAALRVHNRLGPGLKEAFYQRALSLEFEQSGLSYEREYPVKIHIDGTEIGLLYLDHLVEDQVVVEEKAVAHLLTDEEVAQLITYLCATGKSVGLLINFGRRRLEYRRIFPPRNVEAWRNRIRRYVWTPPDTRFADSWRRRPFVDEAGR